MALKVYDPSPRPGDSPATEQTRSIDRTNLAGDIAVIGFSVSMAIAGLRVFQGHTIEPWVIGIMCVSLIILHLLIILRIATWITNIVVYVKKVVQGEIIQSQTKEESDDATERSMSWWLPRNVYVLWWASMLGCGLAIFVFKVPGEQGFTLSAVLTSTIVAALNLLYVLCLFRPEKQKTVTAI